MSATASASPKPFTGKHMLALMLGFFGTVVAVNLALALFAAETWTGLVVENAYVASQHFNDDLEKAREQRTLGWHSALAYRQGVLHFDIATREGAALPGLAVAAILRRPTHEGEDRRVVLTPSEDGGYTARTALASGGWNAEIQASDVTGRQYRRTFRLWAGDRP
jgi:nitrogen fixation protein FixH